MAVIGKLIANFCVLFLAIDIIGQVISFLSVFAELKPKQIKKNVLDSVYFVFFIAVGFMLLCRLIFALIGISPSDLQIAAGVLLFIFSVCSILNREEEISVAKSSAVFPAAAQLIIGPVFLVALLVLMSLNGFIITVLSLVINLIVVLYVLINYTKVIGLLEISGVRIISKVINMLLCAYAVMLIRQAIVALIS